MVHRMTRKGLYSAIIATVSVTAFAAGLFEPELRASGLPEVFPQIRPGVNGRQLDPITTYNRVLQHLRTKYYGELPNDRQLTYEAIRGMVNTLDDPYTEFMDPDEFRQMQVQNEGGFEGIGASLHSTPTPEGFIRVIKPFPDGPAGKAGVLRNDLITKIDGKSVVGMSVDEAVRLIRGRAGTTVRLTIQRTGEDKPLEFAIVRQSVELEVVESRMLEGNVGYVYLHSFNDRADRKVEAAIRDLQKQGMKALVLDLRGNPGGLLDASIDIASRFIPPGRGVVYIVESGGQRELKRTDRSRYLGDEWPLVVLVNRTSASASEIVAGAIQDNKAGTVIGTTTFGKGLVQSLVPMQEGTACKITTSKYLTPSGRNIHRSRDQRGGVEPDILVEVTEEQFFKGEDPQLAKALEVLHQRIGYQPKPKQEAAGTATAEAERLAR